MRVLSQKKTPLLSERYFESHECANESKSIGAFQSYFDTTLEKLTASRRCNQSISALCRLKYFSVLTRHG